MAIEVRNSRLLAISCFSPGFYLPQRTASASTGFVEEMSGAACLKAFQKDNGSWYCASGVLIDSSMDIIYPELSVAYR